MSSLLTKDDILKEHEFDVHYYGGGRRNVLEAMDIYAKQECTAFGEWISDEYDWHGNWKCWIPKLTAFITPDERYTTEQLYELYLLSIKQG